MSAALPAVIALALAASEPYVRSRVSALQNAHCLWWQEGSTIEYRQHARGNPATTGDTELTAVARSFQSWQAVMDQCGSLTLQEGPRTDTLKVGHDVGSSSNENVVLFRTEYCADKVPSSDPCWRVENDDCMNRYDCWHYARGTIALTTTTFDQQSGFIYGADIEANAYSFIFTTVDAPPCVSPVFNQSCVATDVENTMTHEIGHLLGLDHTSYPGSTMNASAPPGETSKRSIDQGSKEFICETYPKGLVSRDCVIIPLDETLGPAAGPVLPLIGGCSAAGWMELLPPGVAALFALRLARRRRSTR